MEEPQNIPIPTQLPELPDLSALPSHILRSGAVETLIQQNEDLMSRLTVALRRNSQMESSTQDIEKINKILTHKLEVLEDKIQILKQKDQLLAQKNSKVDADIDKYKEKIRLLETQFAEVYSTSKERQVLWLGKIEIFSNRLRRFVKYRTKIQAVSERIRSRFLSLQQECLRLQNELDVEKSRTQDLKSNLGRTTEYIQIQARDFETNTKDLVRGYETKLNDTLRDLQLIQAKHAELVGQTAALEKAQASLVELENANIRLKRSYEELREQSDQDLNLLQREVADLRLKYKSQILENENLNRDMADTKTAMKAVKEENKRMEDQVETLQVLWKDSQSQIEKLQEKVQSLQKLNQQLSQSLNQYRKTTERLQAEQQLRPESNMEDESNSNLKKLEPELMNKIDGLLDEIQTGFSKSSTESTIGFNGRTD